MTSLLRRVLPTSFADRLRAARARRRTLQSLPAGTYLRGGRPHTLPGKLFVSLTSFSRRFASLHLTIGSLLDQTIRPDGVLLWIAHAEIAQLSLEVRALEERGLRILPCDDVRSYKKLVFALDRFPDAFIATADDDLFYAPDWLETLVSGVEPGARTILCHRAHRVTLESSGAIAPYDAWPEDVQDAAARRPSVDLLPTGAGGVLYPPGCFGADALDRATYMQLSPNGDDLWFYWMARRAGATHKKVGGVFRQLAWTASQRSALYAVNRGGGNDRAILALEEAYGSPLVMPVAPRTRAGGPT